MPEQEAVSTRADHLIRAESQEHWGKVLARNVAEVFPDRDVYTVAAGISPSGVVHFGNFRDVMTAHTVAKGLAELGKKTRFIFSWDDFDRFRKVPAGVDASFAEHIGKPLSAIPDPKDCHRSYAEHFKVEFEAAMAELGISLEYRNQSELYQSGAYDDHIIAALKKREAIADIMLAFMSDKAKAEKGIDSAQYRSTYYPINLYSRFTGKDSTEILAYDGERSVTYRCLDTNNQETIDLKEVHIAKLAWKIDWPMRWGVEGVVFEPGGHDHASPGGSFDVASRIASDILHVTPPVFVEYKFVGLQGLGSKMSGSKGNAVSPKQLLEIYEPALLKWLYLKKTPHQAFHLAFDSEIYRQYDEFDREVVAWRQKKLDSSAADAITWSLTDAKSEAVEHPIPFRQAVGFGQIIQWSEQKLTEVLNALELNYDEQSVARRLRNARAWLETYNPSEVIALREAVNIAYVATMSPIQIKQIGALRELLAKESHNIPTLEAALYSIPKDPALSDKENSPRQRAFFKDVYNLLIGSDAGPRLSTFLWAANRQQVLKLLAIE